MEKEGFFRKKVENIARAAMVATSLIGAAEAGAPKNTEVVSAQSHQSPESFEFKYMSIDGQLSDLKNTVAECQKTMQFLHNSDKEMRLKYLDDLKGRVAAAKSKIDALLKRIHSMKENDQKKKLMEEFRSLHSSLGYIEEEIVYFSKPENQ